VNNLRLFISGWSS